MKQRSIQSRLVNFLLQNRHFLSFRLKPRSFLDGYTLEAFRAQTGKTNRMLARLPEGIQAKGEKIDHLNLTWLYGEGISDQKVILYAHGGGYVSGSIAAHRALVAKIVKSFGIQALLFEYRLAPENPFPAGLEDTLLAYQYLLDKGFDPGQIVFFGDSAGGGMVLSALMAIKQKNLSMPACAVAVSPWVDLTCRSQSYVTRAKRCLSPEGSWDLFSAYYTDGQDPENPLISPLFGEPDGLPPLFITVGTDEVMHDEVIAFSKKAEESGVETELRIGEGMLHCYPMLAPMFPEATRTLAEIEDFLNRTLSRENF